MVSKLLAHTGRRSELVELLLAATRELQGADGCELYVVSQDRDDLDKIRVFEAWRDEAAHRASPGHASGPRGHRAPGCRSSPWWLGYLDTGAHDIVFHTAPK